MSERIDIIENTKAIFKMMPDFTGDIYDGKKFPASMNNFNDKGLDVSVLENANDFGAASAKRIGEREKENRKRAASEYFEKTVNSKGVDFLGLPDTDKDILADKLNGFILKLQSSSKDISNQDIENGLKIRFLKNLDSMKLSKQSMEFIKKSFENSIVDGYDEIAWDEFLAKDENKNWNSVFSKAREGVVDLSQSLEEFKVVYPNEKPSIKFSFNLKAKFDEYLNLHINKNIELDNKERELWRNVLAAAKRINSSTQDTYAILGEMTYSIDNTVLEKMNTVNTLVADEIESKVIEEIKTGNVNDDSIENEEVGTTKVGSIVAEKEIEKTPEDLFDELRQEFKSFTIERYQVLYDKMSERAERADEKGITGDDKKTLIADVLSKVIRDNIATYVKMNSEKINNISEYIISQLK